MTRRENKQEKQNFQDITISERSCKIWLPQREMAKFNCLRERERGGGGILLPQRIMAKCDYIREKWQNMTISERNDKIISESNGKIWLPQRGMCCKLWAVLVLEEKLKLENCQSRVLSRRVQDWSCKQDKAWLPQLINGTEHNKNRINTINKQHWTQKQDKNKEVWHCNVSEWLPLCR